MANFFRADLAGSLVKPRALLEAEAAFASGTLDFQGLEAAQNAAVQQALALQKESGLTFVTDGEFRRPVVDSPYVDAIGGIRQRSGGAGVAGAAGGGAARGGAGAGAAASASGGAAGASGALGDAGDAADWRSHYCVATRLQQNRRLVEHELSFLKAHTKVPTKVSLLAPSALALRMFEPGVTDAVYSRLPALAVAFAEILQGELDALTSEGARYIQLSCPAYAWLSDAAAISQLKLPGVDTAFEELLDVDMRMLERLRRSANTAVGLYIGRCAAADPASDSFERMLENVLPRAPVDRFLLEYCGPQPHDFSALGALPQAKIAALGLVSTDTEPESLDALMARFEQASARTDERNLALSARRGFSNHPGRSPEDSIKLQRHSLERTIEVVQYIWGLEF